MTFRHPSFTLPASNSRPWAPIEAVRTLRAIWDRLRTTRAARRTACELAAMDDRQLLDIGISRGEIDRISSGCLSHYSAAVLGRLIGEGR